MSGYAEDEKLLIALHAGDARILRQVYERYRESFQAYIRKSCRCDDERARDIYPESFSILYFNIQRGQLASPLQSSLKTYLFAIGRHLYLRRFMDKYHTSVMHGDELPVFPVEHAVDHALEKQEQAVVLAALLGKLGDPCAKLLKQIYFENIPYATLSEILREPEGTLRKRKFDCLRKLRSLAIGNSVEL